MPLVAHHHCIVQGHAHARRHQPSVVVHHHGIAGGCLPPRLLCTDREEGREKGRQDRNLPGSPWGWPEVSSAPRAGCTHSDPLTDLALGDVCHNLEHAAQLIGVEALVPARALEGGQERPQQRRGGWSAIPRSAKGRRGEEGEGSWKRKARSRPSGMRAKREVAGTRRVASATGTGPWTSVTPGLHGGRRENTDKGQERKLGWGEGAETRSKSRTMGLRSHMISTHGLKKCCSVL